MRYRKVNMMGRRWLGYLGLLSLAIALSGCAGGGRHVSAWGEITLAPGDTGNCASSPCTVLLEMPPGTDSYRVTANEVEVGSYPAGKTISLGSLFESNAIKVEGAGVPPAYVYIPNVR